MVARRLAGARTAAGGSDWSTSSWGIWRTVITRANVRAYAYDLLAFARWLMEGVGLAEVDIDVLLRFLTACREATLPGGRAATCIRSATAASGMRRRRSTGGWRRSRLVRVPGDA